MTKSRVSLGDAVQISDERIAETISRQLRLIAGVRRQLGHRMTLGHGDASHLAPVAVG
ncbi:MAG: hypothetical protein ACTHMY_25080 [Solirubrobacteraceae bacterium]